MAATPSVLVIDRDSDLSALLGTYLLSSGYRMVYTNRVREAIRKLSNQQFTHIFLDPQLAPDNTATLLRELETPGTLNFRTPLTFMTSVLDYSIPFESVKRIHSIIGKPFPLGEFIVRLQSAAAAKVAPKVKAS